MQSGECYNVVVAGGGPAGSVLAARLAAGGLSVLLAEAGDYDRARPGEFLSPAARSLVNRCGLLPSGWEGAHQSIHEFVSTWGGGDALARNYIFNADGHALVLDRARFDRDFAAAAEEKGACLMKRCRVRRVSRARNGWKVELEHNSRVRTTACDFLAVCCGRAGSPFAGLEVKRERRDKLLCLGLRVGGYSGDSRPSTEAHPHGWVYSAGLSTGELVINAFMEPAERQQTPSLDLLLREVAACPIVASRVMEADIASASQVAFFAADASSLRSRPVAGPNWCLAGDAAQCFDPLSSAGIAQAIRHGTQVAEAVLRSPCLSHVYLSEYRESLEQSYSQYETERKRIYALEQRWDTPFWRASGAVAGQDEGLRSSHPGSSRLGIQQIQASNG